MSEELPDHLKDYKFLHAATMIFTSWLTHRHTEKDREVAFD